MGMGRRLGFKAVTIFLIFIAVSPIFFGLVEAAKPVHTRAKVERS
jgi:hypothetical protein